MEGKALLLVPPAAFLSIILFVSASFLLRLLPGRALFPVISTGSLSLALVSASFLCALRLKLLEWARPTPKGLPPGSMGWPYIGETLRLYTQDPNTFFSDRIKWYGSIFKTHILGCPSIMISSPQAAKIVLVSRAHLFNPKYPHGKEMLIGPQALFFHQGAYHSVLKKLIQSTLLPSSIQGHVSEIESLVHKMLRSWDNNVINTLDEMKMFAFDVAMLFVFGHSQYDGKEGMKELYYCIEKGYNALPCRLPGTPFHKAMKARRALHEMLRRMIEKRREENKDSEGLLGAMLRSKDEDVIQLNDSQIADNIVGVIFAAHDTTASVLTWILKYLSDHPDLLDSVTEEQESIRREIMRDGSMLTWQDTRKMTLTSRVIQETLRTASILSFTFREAVEDVEFDGYFIPRGWKVLPLFRAIHHCADFFPQPEKFDPSRFEVPPRPYTYMPFGNGVHSCPGSELAKLEMVVLLHHLTIKYRWEVVGVDDGVQYRPFPIPKQGLPLRVTPRI